MPAADVLALVDALPAGEDPVAYVKSVNLKRRHLTGSQRSAAIVACSEWHPAHREKKSVVATDFRAPTSAQLAKEADVSVSTITHAKAAHSAGVGAAVRDGRITAERGARDQTRHHASTFFAPCLHRARTVRGCLSAI